MQFGALAHHYHAWILKAGFRLKTCNFRCFFFVLCILSIVYWYFPFPDCFPLMILFIPFFFWWSSGLLYGRDLGQCRCVLFAFRTQAIGFLAEGECYGATFHPWG
jgi:hypothetical protein